MNTLKIQSLSAGYGKRRVISDVTFCANSGEIIALLGENGCGKTTLFRAIQGSIPTIHGEVFVNGAPLSAMSPRKRAFYVTTMPQEQSGVAGLTGRDLAETAFYPKRGFLGRPTESDKLLISDTARKFGVERLLDRDLSEMSAGERQLMGLLRAAVQDTPVLLLDEPSSALDFNRTTEMFDLLHSLSDEGRIILIVLHDPTLALRHATSIIRMAHGAAEEILDNRTQNPAVAESFLQKLYPAIRVNQNPLFCYVSSRKDTI